MCQASTPSQSPVVGVCAKVHGQGMLHLQTSNQSPAICHPDTSVPLVASVDMAFSSFGLAMGMAWVIRRIHVVDVERAHAVRLNDGRALGIGEVQHPGGQETEGAG